jgi:ABC-2 type transport system permease protein
MKIFSKELFKLEFKRSFKGLLTWSLSIGLTMVFVIVLYPMVKDIYSSIPAQYADFLDSFGGIPHNILEYFATEGGLMLQLFGSIFAVLEGFNAINRDEREKTVESLYQLPYTRSLFFRTKLLRVFTNVLIFAFINYILSYISFFIVKESIDFGQFSYFNLLNMIQLIIIAFLGFGLACFLKPNQKNMIAFSIPFPLYIISVLSTMTNNATLEKLKYLTPFTFSNPVDILKSSATFEWISFVVFCSLTVVVIFLSYIRFNKREFMV